MARRKIANSRILLTGASSGIGKELTLQLARQKARLLITARREELLHELAEKIAEQGHAPPLIEAGDITDPRLRQRLIERTEAEWQGLDVLINNAGVGAIGPFAAAEEDRLRRVMEVNFFAPLELIRSAIPVLRRGRKPIIVNVSSVLGHRAVPNKSEYSASKFALHGFSDALRAELAGQIDVLLVSPSTTSSEFFDNVLEGDKSTLSWRKMGAMTPQAVARAAISAIRAGRHEVILSLAGKGLVWLDRWFPPLVNRIIARYR